MQKEKERSYTFNTFKLRTDVRYSHVNNALKYSQCNMIQIDLSIEKDTVKVFFQDDGIGIPKEKQVSVFDKFVQLRPIEKNYQGTGLGLSIVKRLLLLFDSDISLKSESYRRPKFQRQY